MSWAENPKLLCFGSLDSEVQIRFVERLLNSQVGRPGNVANLLEQLARPDPIAFQVIAR